MPRYQRREGGHCTWDVDARHPRNHCAPGTTRKLEGSISVREPSGPSPIDAEGQGIDARGHAVRRYRTKARDKDWPISSTRSATPASPETLDVVSGSAWAVRRTPACVVQLPIHR